ncbi:stage II sporulation protein M [Thermococcus sp.]|uniref:stage II sporulation protein M n=1 Tax=Thermococcus sp. TaxID=35749 RepID=UPI00261FC3D4|nr:stage II sporulation protein M [Thermococcus sp.]
MKRVWRYLLYLSFVFLLGLLAGIAYAYSNPQNAGAFVGRLAREIGPLSPDPFKNFLRIFVHNSMVALMVLLSGLFFGIGPWLMVGFNGVVVGIVSGFLSIEGFPAEKLFLGLVPHGIFEIPGFLLAGAAGLEWYRRIREAEEASEGFKKGVKIALKLYLLTLLLLLIAAFVEAYVTPKVAGLG